MNPLLKEIRRNPLLWLLAFVPVVFVADQLVPEAPTLLFMLSILAIVPLAALLSQATESVATKTVLVIARVAVEHDQEIDKGETICSLE